MYFSISTARKTTDDSASVNISSWRDNCSVLKMGFSCGTYDLPWIIVPGFELIPRGSGVELRVL